MRKMKEMEEKRPAAYWSYTADKRFEPVNPMMKTLHNPNPVYRIAEPPRTSTTAITSIPMSSSSYALPSWRVGDREVKRKKRVATYKAYAVEGKVKASIRSSFRWVKNKYSTLIHGC